MNNEIYKSAMNKISANDDMKSKINTNVVQISKKKQKTPYIKFIPITIVLVIALLTGIKYLPNLSQNNNHVNDSEEFEILGEMSGEACYIIVVYLDGYAYSPESWIAYDYNSTNYDYKKGDKIGEVTLDLKGKRYKGTPPNYSSTLNLGTELYEIVNIKRERAIIAKQGEFEHILYRERKAIADLNETMDLKISEIFNMITEKPIVTEVELRNEENGSWIRTSKNENLISLINEELPNLELLNHGQINKKPINYRVPVNLMFEDGSALHVQFYPNENYASLFGGYIIISEELSTAINDLYKEGEQYKTTTDLIPYDLNSITYLKIINHLENYDILCKEPSWSGGALNSILDYYRISPVEPSSLDKLVMTMEIGSTEEDSIIIEFYNKENSKLRIKIKDKYYDIIKGDLTYEDLKEYLNNYTEINAIH
jgi:hypothetical protein